MFDVTSLIQLYFFSKNTDLSFNSKCDLVNINRRHTHHNQVHIPKNTSLEQLGLDGVKLRVPSVNSVWVGVEAAALRAGEALTWRRSSAKSVLAVWNEDSLLSFLQRISWHKQNKKQSPAVCVGGRETPDIYIYIYLYICIYI